MTPGRAGGERDRRSAPRLSSSRIARVTALLAILAPAGCRHLLEPVEPRALSITESEAVRFPPGTSAWIENAYVEPEMTELLVEGAHSIEADLREWTARLVSEIALELRRRGVTVHVPESSLRGTPVPLLPPAGLPADPATFKKLRVRISAIEPPDRMTGRGPRIRAEVESADGALAAAYSVGEGARGFRDALFDLKKIILDDSRLGEWLGRGPDS